MEKAVERFFNKQIVGTAAERFELELHSLQKLGSFENYIYEGSKNGEAYILRLVHSSHRSKEQIASELDWLNYLRTCGANVCGAFLSENSSFIESIPAEETFFHASLFEKAKGSAVSMDDPAFNPTLFEAWGRTIGQFHQLTKNYKRPAHIEPRPDLVQSFEQQLLPFVPMNDKALYHNVKHLFEQVQKIPKTANRYQLIHSDLHRGNFHYDNGNIYAFDFDDCSHHHIVHDLAMPLYYSVWLKYDSIEQRNEFAAHFLPPFLRGYQKELELPEGWLKELALFCSFRDCELYAVLHKKWDMSQLNERQGKLLSSLAHRIRHDEPFINLELTV